MSACTIDQSKTCAAINLASTQDLKLPRRESCLRLTNALFYCLPRLLALHTASVSPPQLNSQGHVSDTSRFFRLQLSNRNLAADGGPVGAGRTSPAANAGNKEWRISVVKNPKVWQITYTVEARILMQRAQVRLLAVLLLSASAFARSTCQLCPVANSQLALLVLRISPGPTDRLSR